MAIRTALTEAFGLAYPIVLAPMGTVAGGQLAAAVSNAGGLGLVGGGYGDPDWLMRELALVQAATDRPWGVGLITWHATADVVELVLRYSPHRRPPLLRRCPPLCAGHQGGRVHLDLPGPRRGGGVRGCGRRGGLHRGPGQRGGWPWRGPRHPPPGPGGGRCGRARPGPGCRRHRRWAGVGRSADARGTRGDDRDTLFGGERIADARAGEGADRRRQAPPTPPRPASSTLSAGMGRGQHPTPRARCAMTSSRDGTAAKASWRRRWSRRCRPLQQAMAEGDCETGLVFAGEAVDLIDAVEPAADLVQRIGVEAEARLRGGPALLA